MDLTSLTDELIQRLLFQPKRVRNPRARSTEKAKHVERNYEVEARDCGDQYVLITRQSTIIPDNFSCGLVWLPAPGQRVILTRYNGSDHPHSNPIEGTSFAFRCHIHRATARYIQVGRKTEMFAEHTDRYSTLGDALECLVSDCNIEGFGSSNDEGSQLGLF